MKKVKIFLIALMLVILSCGPGYTLTQEEAIEEAQDTITKAADEVIWWGNWNKVKKYAKELIEKYPYAYPGYLFMGIALDEKGKQKKAIEYYRQALELSPNNSSIFQNMGLAYCNMRDYKNCLKYSKKALELNPNSKYSQEQIKRAYRGYKVGDIRELQITKIDDNHFMIKKEDIVRSFYIYDGQSLVGKDVAEPIEKELGEIIKKKISCKYKVYGYSSKIDEDVYFEGTNWDEAVGSWTEHWEFCNACGMPRVVPVKFYYDKGIIKGNYDANEIRKPDGFN